MSSRLVESVIAHNLAISEEYSSPGATLARRLHRSRYPTEIITHECMDGRSYLRVIVGVPKGILYDFRNIGGYFDLGWPYYGEMVLRLVNYATERGRNVASIITYHYSEGEHTRGCKGFGFDTEKAIQSAGKLKEQYGKSFGSGVHAFVWGIETDSDAIVLHGEAGEREKVDPRFFVAEFRQELVQSLLTRLYPSVPTRVTKDLVPLIVGNLEHQETMSPDGKGSELDHTEEVIAIGWRLDTLNPKNKVLTVGPFDPEGIEKAVATAGHLVLGNIQEQRIPGDEILLMASMPYWDETGPEKFLAGKRAKYLARKGFEIIKQHEPNLVPLLNVIALRINMNTRRAEIVEHVVEKAV